MNRRLSSHIWVAALLRRVSAQGGFAVILRKGHKQSGAIYIIERHLHDKASLYAPALQLAYDDETVQERLFECVLEQSAQGDVEEKLLREQKFDADIWIVEVESCDLRSVLEV